MKRHGLRKGPVNIPLPAPADSLRSAVGMAARKLALTAQFCRCGVRRGICDSRAAPPPPPLPGLRRPSRRTDMCRSCCSRGICDSRDAPPVGAWTAAPLLELGPAFETVAPWLGWIVAEIFRLVRCP